MMLCEASMSPPSMECLDRCDFSAPPAIPTYKLLVKALELHTQSHTFSAKSQPVKEEKPTRLTLMANMTEAD